MYKKLLIVPLVLSCLIFTTIPHVSATSSIKDQSRYASGENITSMITKVQTVRLLPNLQFATQWQPLQLIDDPLKPWRITFNQPINITEENTYKVKILDHVGTEFVADVSLNSKGLVLTPILPYEEGQTYTLMIQRNIDNYKGIQLGKDVYQQFTYRPKQNTDIKITDPALENVIRTTLSKPTGNITTADMLSLENLVGVDEQIRSLTGLEYAINLKRLYLQHNLISDIKPLESLVNLTELSLEDNRLSDISALSNMGQLSLLWLNRNQISIIDALRNLKSLQGLDLQSNRITNIDPLVDIPNFNWLSLKNNKITTVDSLLSMNTKSLEYLWLTENPLEYGANHVVETLRARGVGVSHDEVISFTIPPYHGTVFVDPNIITANDSSSFTTLRYKGMGNRTMYDRRSESWIQTFPYLFQAEYSDGHPIEIQVNPEFPSIAEAESQALRFAHPIGQLPNYLRENVLTVWIHKGTELFGGGNNNILIHTEQADEYTELGVLEEVLFHEATHTSLDSLYSHHPDWKAAQRYDENSISSYAKEFPDREDVAESFLLYYAIRQNPNRIHKEMADVIKNTIPNRIKFFDQQLQKMK
ncbi:leucine-rich repeat domain-containing protein [Sporosarcina ureae]|uniref:leucine-rich repeat domain-containing protein n=1 Tax=Sporosarcina ureae TaxID=1571 RepID=UPI0026EDE9C9|nr:leucine-rich repeat domain-containing protein [Sporosarcina ureae]